MMPFGRSQQKDTLPESQLMREQREKYAQPKPLVYKRKIDKSKGIVKDGRKK